MTFNSFQYSFTAGDTHVISVLFVPDPTEQFNGLFSFGARVKFRPALDEVASVNDIVVPPPLRFTGFNPGATKERLLGTPGDALDPSTLAARDFIGGTEFQNGADAVQLLRPDSLVADALQYGDAGVNNADEGTPAPDVTPGISLSRDA